MAKRLPVRAIGPTIPSMYLDKRLTHDKEYSLTAFKPMTDSCMNWLDKQLPKSVIYVSFGSFTQPGAEQIEELALALKTNNMNFLWVVRAFEEPKIPQNYRDEVFEKGLILTWCPQLEVLVHEAIGCFISHCAWNSTFEALSSGVPIVGLPQWSDQSTNAKLVEEVWKMGIKARQDEIGIVRRDEIARCIKYVMEGETLGVARKWKALTRKAVDVEGSSDRNIEEFISSMMKK